MGADGGSPPLVLTPLAGSRYVVRAGPHNSRAVEEVGDELRAAHQPVPRSMTVVCAKVLCGRTMGRQVSLVGRSGVWVSVGQGDARVRAHTVRRRWVGWGTGTEWLLPLRPPVHHQATLHQRRLCAGDQQLAQGQVTALRLSQWAALLLANEVQMLPNLEARLALSLRLAGYNDYVSDRVRSPTGLVGNHGCGAPGCCARVCAQSW